ncbi:UbiD family decarboxylase [Siculibacillus lacustris]|uniref:UbiD family decarboxylase n=1 Tax=Siculibacillus lacustris TaxID=1549641 RepID=A0A4Q9VZV3_9HYPH|nr:UbiD family decarboxylase [Siculibacillus lacustris]TBW41054.1 UbiD family decarboxylase [Siculibacillus lacustris]
MPSRDHPTFRDLRDFVAFLERRGDLVRVREPVSTVHEMTEIHRRVLEAQGPALLFEKPLLADGRPSPHPVLVNLFGTVERVALGFGIEAAHLGRLGDELAALRDPTPPEDFADALRRLPMLKAAMSTRPRKVSRAAVQERVLTGADIDLGSLPVQTCWPGEPAPLVTWGLVVTRPPDSRATSRYNVGVYRMQVAGPDRLIMRWLAHRGGAGHHRAWVKRGEEMPVAVVIGADPGTILSAVLPLPETLSEVHFSGLLRGERPRLVDAVSVPLKVPADAEIVVEGFVSPTETLPEGPYGDHTGYYNSVEDFPVMRVTAITMRREPIYLSTYTGRPPDEPSRMGEAFNRLFLPLLKKQFPEVVDFWLPPEACSYRIAVASIVKSYPGQARRVMMGLWSMLPQFAYTKMIILVDADIDIRDWKDVMWAVSTRSDPSRDVMLVDRTPIDYLDFASPKSGLGGKMGLDATTKVGTETEREWGRVLTPDPAVSERIDAMWDRLGLDLSGKSPP